MKSPFIAFSALSAMVLGFTGGPTPESISVSTTKNPAEIEHLLGKVKRELRAKETNPDYIWFRYSSEHCVEDLKMPPEFKELEIRLEANYAEKNYGICADIATQMQAMIPRTLPDKFVYRSDYYAEWRSKIADLRTLANDYKGAVKDYTIALNEPAPNYVSRDGQKSDIKKLMGHQEAAYGRAMAYALLGKRKEALADLRAAPDYYFSGCGNCMEGETHEQNRLETVYTAATEPAPESEVQLLRLVAGGYDPLFGLLTFSSVLDEKHYAEEDAALFLGELYLKEGKIHLAKLTFEALAGCGDGDYARMAQSRLRSMPPK